MIYWEHMTIGVDGASGGWCVATYDGDDIEIYVYESFARILSDFLRAERMLVDMPIGLPETERRACDEAASQFLGSRASTIFFAPSRMALEQTEYTLASTINKEQTGYGLSKQSWSIMPYILEVNRAMRSNTQAASYVRESHPEVCFAAFNGEVISVSKRSEEGLRIRKRVLSELYASTHRVLTQALDTYMRSQLGEDDALDAMVLALAGTYPLQTLPDVSEVPRDIYDVPMAIYYPRVRG